MRESSIESDFPPVLLFVGVLHPMLNAGASTPLRGELCAEAKLGLHLSALTYKKVNKHNRWGRLNLDIFVPSSKLL